MGDVLIQVAVTAFGTFLGAVLAVLSVVLFRIRDQRRDELAAVDNVVHLLSVRRALVIGDPRVLPSVDVSDWTGDFARAGRSVVAMRDELIQSMSSLPSGNRGRMPIRRMISSCNTYLEMSAAAPVRYWIELDCLRASLTGQVRILQSANPRCSKLLPGAAAFDA
jgi:hypothetical protein